MDIHEVRRDYFPFKSIIADGGIKNAGDCVKALCFSDMVMCGNIFAGCDEAPGKKMVGGGKVYRGASTHKTSHVEGVEAYVSPAGPYIDVLDRTLEGIRSGCSYQGVKKIADLRLDPHLIRITSAGLRESYPHDVRIINQQE